MIQIKKEGIHYFTIMQSLSGVAVSTHVFMVLLQSVVFPPSEIQFSKNKNTKVK